MRVKKQELVLCKDSPDVVAERIKRGMGLEKARRVSSGLAKSLVDMEPSDVNEQVTSFESIKRGRLFWTQVRNILANQKGFTVIELLALASILASFCVAGLALYMILHFVTKFW